MFCERGKGKRGTMTMHRWVAQRWAAPLSDPGLEQRVTDLPARPANTPLESRVVAVPKDHAGPVAQFAWLISHLRSASWMPIGGGEARAPTGPPTVTRQSSAASRPDVVDDAALRQRPLGVARG
jgi:hypothetical protein